MVVTYKTTDCVVLTIKQTIACVVLTIKQTTVCVVLTINHTTACVVLSNNRLLPMWCYHKTNDCLCCAAIFLDYAYSNSFHTTANNLKFHISASVNFMEELYGMLYYNSLQYSLAHMLSIQIIRCIAFSLE
jgi:hypothetical protein